MSKRPKQTAEIRIIFKSWVSEQKARRVLDRLEILRYHVKRVDGRKKSLVTLSVLVPLRPSIFM